MSVVRSGSTRSYSDNWDQVFGKKQVAKKQVATTKATKKTTKKAKRAKK